MKVHIRASCPLPRPVFVVLWGGGGGGGGGRSFYKNDAKRIAYAAVLVPGEPDSDGEVLSPERVERAAHEWLAGYRNIDLQHSLNNIAVPVESYIQPMDRTVDKRSPKLCSLKEHGFFAAKIQDDNTWEQIVSGKLTGYSVMGIRRQALSDAAGKSVALKRTLLRDLGEDWIAAAVKRGGRTRCAES